MPHNEPLEGAGELIKVTAGALSEPSFPPEMFFLMNNVSTFLNASIGLIITLVVVLFCIYLIRWILRGSETEEGKEAAKAATRAFIVLFLIIDVWFIIRLLQIFEDISPIFAYGIVLVSFLLIGCWSLLGIGQTLLDAIAWTVNRIVDVGIRFIRAQSASTSFIRRLQRYSDTTLRFLVLAIIVGGFLLYAMWWSWMPATDAEGAQNEKAAFVYDSRGELDGNTYRNPSLGFSITFPEDWTLTLPGGGQLFEAERGSISAGGVVFVEGEYAEALIAHSPWRAQQVDDYVRSYESIGWRVYQFTGWDAGDKTYAITIFADSPQDPADTLEASYIYIGRGNRVVQLGFINREGTEGFDYLYETIPIILESISFE